MNKKLQDQLVQKAAEAAKNAYAPYSKFQVGAALLTAGKKRIITGGNVENASFGLTLCAERTALAAAVAAGFRRFEALAVCAMGGKIAVPCGACLQMLAEFCGPDFIIIAAGAAAPDRIRKFKLRDLLPHAFRFQP